ncbi:MAG: hypothetical protein WCS17_08925 [Prevotella sp.]
MEYTNIEAYEVGKKQKAIMWLIIASLVAFCIPFATFVVGIVGIVLVYQLAKAQKSPVAWLWALLQIIPIVSLICLVIINQKATTILKEKGISVGLMGGDSTQLENLRTM